MTEADIVLHAGQTGDLFPHHMDAEWCATQPCERRVAHGTLRGSAGITARYDHEWRPAELGMAEETVTAIDRDGQVVPALVHLYVVEKRAVA